MKRIHANRYIPERDQPLPLCGPPWTDDLGNPTWVGTDLPSRVTCLLCQRALHHQGRLD